MLAERQIVIILVMWARSGEYMWAVKYKIFLFINQQKAKPLPAGCQVTVVLMSWWAGHAAR